MAIFDVLVNTDDLVVLGPPEIIDLNVSIGSQGQRGATFYVGQGNPNEISISENFLNQNISPASGDLFINTATGSKYGWLYIYNPKIVGNQWDEVLRLQPALYAIEFAATFESGTSTVSIPLTNFTLPSTVSEDNFVITATVNNSNPAALGISSKTIISSNLEIVFNGVEYVSTSWAPLDGVIDLSINVAVI